MIRQINRIAFFLIHQCIATNATEMTITQENVEHKGEPLGSWKITVAKVKDPEPPQLYWIWSWEHDAWWGPNHRGYVSHARAGVYTYEEALDIVTGANYGFHIGGEKMPYEAMVPIPKNYDRIKARKQSAD